MNIIQLIGNLGRDAEMNYTPKGTAVTKFGIGVSRGSKNADGSWNNETDWFNIICWNDLALRAASIGKGKRVYVEGKLTTRKYTDKDGVERSVVEVIANKMHLVSALPKPDEQGEPVSEGNSLGSLEDHPF